MPRFASRNVVTGAIAFAIIVVVVSVLGVGAGELLFYLLYLVPTLVVLYLVVRWAVAAGVVDAGRSGVAVGRSGAREVLDARYAGGEIGAEEYERVRARLETP
jgi:uncharacterized membrane protein